MVSVVRPEDVGALARSRRRSLGLSQAKLAERLGTSQDWVSRLESGKPTLQLGLVLRALRELGVTLSDESNPATPNENGRSATKNRPRISLKDIVDG